MLIETRNDWQCLGKSLIEMPGTEKSREYARQNGCGAARGLIEWLWRNWKFCLESREEQGIQRAVEDKGSPKLQPPKSRYTA